MSTQSTWLMVAGALLGSIGGILVFRFGRRIEAEGKKVGFDFSSRNYVLSWFRSEKLPDAMRPLTKRARLAGMLFLWPAFVLMCAAFFLG